jgi:MYXO-CTERM domain-containing protein
MKPVMRGGCDSSLAPGRSARASASLALIAFAALARRRRRRPDDG